VSTSTQQPPAATTAPPKISIIHKIGDTILHVFEWPITHAEMLNELLGSVEKDVPQTKSVLEGLVSKIEGMGPDAIGALADKGLNIGDDVKVGTDIQGLFTYIQQTVMPTIQADYTDFKRISVGGSPVIAPPAEPGEAVAGPGLHNVVAP
jgi:hypothetical protein